METGAGWTKINLSTPPRAGLLKISTQNNSFDSHNGRDPWANNLVIIQYVRALPALFVMEVIIVIITLGATLTRAPGTLDADTSWERSSKECFSTSREQGTGDEK